LLCGGRSSSLTLLTTHHKTSTEDLLADSGPVRVANLLRTLSAIGAGAYIVLLIVLVALRVGYPFELEWLEGAMVDHVRTILSGAPLYAKPSLDFIPLTYTPLYFYLAAALAKAIGVGFLPLRLISIAASAGVLLMLYRMAARESNDARAGILAAGLFAAMFGWTDGWLDLARNDSLFLLLALIAIYLLRWYDSPAAYVGAGVLLAFSFLAKQTGLIVSIPLALFCAWRGRLALACFAAAVAAIVLGTTIVFDRIFDGWYLYYVRDVPTQHPLALEMIWGFWRFDVLRPLPFAVLASAGYLLVRLRQRERDAPLLLLLSSAGLCGGAWASRLHSLSYVNVALPAYAALALVFAAIVHDRKFARDLFGPSRLVLTQCALYALAILQIARLAYMPTRLVPTSEDVAAGQSLLTAIAAEPGDVFVPFHGYLPSLAGKNSHAHAVVIADVIRGNASEAGRAFAAELNRAVAGRGYNAVIAIDGRTPVDPWLPIQEHYRGGSAVVTHRSLFWRPEVRYLSR
jgi:4-amino-4-deoxy-L-arabinose transferase-like glycosyltransferase